MAAALSLGASIAMVILSFLSLSFSSDSSLKGQVFTQLDIKPLDKPIEEAPASDPALVKQVYLVPFKGVTMDNLSTFLKK